MDSEGFAPNGLAPPRVGSPKRAPSRMDTAKGTVFTGNKIIHEKPDAESRTIGFFRGIQSGTSMLWFIQFLAMLPVAGLAWVFSAVGWKSGGFALKRWIQAPVNALFKTNVGDVGRFSLEMNRSAADMARESKHTEINGRAAAFDAKADATAAKAVSKGGKAAVQAAGDTAPKGWLGKRLHSSAQKSVDAAHGQVSSIIKTPDEMMAAAQKSGKPVDAAGHAAATKTKNLFQPVFDLLEKAKAAKDPAVRAGLLQQAEAEAAKVARGLTGAEAKAAHGIRDAIGAAGRSTGTLVGHIEALGKGGGAQMMNLARRIPLFYAIVGVGVAAGAIGSALNAKRENRQSKQALQEMQADIGDANHPIIQQASKLEKKAGSRRWVGAGLSTVGDGVFLAPANGPIGFMAMMAGSQLSQVGQLIMPENRSLAAYTMLKKAESGKVQLAPKDKVELLRHLVTAVPAFAKQGGVDNRLAAPVAAEIAKREMNVRDTMRFLASPDQFMEVVQRVSSEQKKIDEAAAAEKAAAEKAAAEKKDAAPAKAPETTADEKPAVTIAGAKGTAQGRVVELNRAIGQV